MMHLWNPLDDDLQHFPWTFKRYIQHRKMLPKTWVIVGKLGEQSLMLQPVNAAQFSSRRVRR